MTTTSTPKAAPRSVKKFYALLERSRSRVEKEIQDHEKNYLEYEGLSLPGTDR